MSQNASVFLLNAQIRQAQFLEAVQQLTSKEKVNCEWLFVNCCNYQTLPSILPTTLAKNLYLKSSLSVGNPFESAVHEACKKTGR